MSDDRELSVPADVQDDPEAQELIRAWQSNGQLICALRPLRWEDSSAWGIVLADVARHVANAIRAEMGDEPDNTVAKIRDIFNRELSDPTDRPTGSFSA